MGKSRLNQRRPIVDARSGCLSSSEPGARGDILSVAFASDGMQLDAGAKVTQHARTDAYPTIRVEENQTEVGHEATVSKVGKDQLFYLMSSLL